jgi:hypothetical protein
MCRLMPSWAGRLASFLGFVGLVLGAVTMTSSTEGLFIAGLAVVFVGIGLILVGLSVDRVRAAIDQGATGKAGQSCRLQ